MVLQMSRPFKHPKTGVYYYRARVPADLVDAFGKGEVKISLQTKEPILAKELFRLQEQKVMARWKTMRTQPEPLTHRQIVALSGKVYRKIAERFHDEPGPAEVWKNIRKLAESVAAMGQWEPWYGGTIDELLLSEGVATDGPSRDRLIQQVHQTLLLAADQQHKKAEGDYSPDPNVTRFPPIAAKETKVGKVSPDLLASRLADAKLLSGDAQSGYAYLRKAYSEKLRTFAEKENRPSPPVLVQLSLHELVWVQTIPKGVHDFQILPQNVDKKFRYTGNYTRNLATIKRNLKFAGRDAEENKTNSSSDPPRLTADQYKILGISPPGRQSIAKRAGLATVADTGRAASEEKTGWAFETMPVLANPPATNRNASPVAAEFSELGSAANTKPPEIDGFGPAPSLVRSPSAPSPRATSRSRPSDSASSAEDDSSTSSDISNSDSTPSNYTVRRLPSLPVDTSDEEQAGARQRHGSRNDRTADNPDRSRSASR